MFISVGSKRVVNHVFISISEKRLISLCVGCGNQIHDQYILRVSPDLEWHAACLKCAECNQYLDESCTCFVRDGKTYCKRDYIRYAIFTELFSGISCLSLFIWRVFVFCSVYLFVFPGERTFTLERSVCKNVLKIELLFISYLWGVGCRCVS